jgi:hypothetical protein
MTAVALAIHKPGMQLHCAVKCRALQFFLEGRLFSALLACLCTAGVRSVTQLLMNEHVGPHWWIIHRQSCNLTAVLCRVLCPGVVQAW